MNSPIWRLAGIAMLGLSLSAHALADNNDQRGSQNRPEGADPRTQQQQMQQQVQQQQRGIQQEIRGQQQQVQQQQQAQQRDLQQQQHSLQQELRGQQQEQRAPQQPTTQWQQRQQEFHERQAERQAEQQDRLQQNRPQAQSINDNRAQPGRQEAPNGGRNDGPAIQGKPGVVWQTQPPIRGNSEGPRGNYAPGRHDDGRWADHRGNGWGPGPQYRPGYTVERFPDREYRVPYRGQDFFYSGGYWYRPQGPRYVVVAPPYGIRTRLLPDYATRVWMGGSLFFMAAGTYYQYADDSQDYVVVNPPQGVPISQPMPVQQAAAQGEGIDVSFAPVNGQSPSQMEQDRYDCQRYAAQQSGFDPATATYAPADSVAYLYRQNMGNCLVGRGYAVN